MAKLKTYKSSLDAPAQFSFAGRVVTLEPGDEFAPANEAEAEAAAANPDVEEAKAKASRKADKS